MARKERKDKMADKRFNGIPTEDLLKEIRERETVVSGAGWGFYIHAESRSGYVFDINEDGSVKIDKSVLDDFNNNEEKIDMNDINVFFHIVSLRFWSKRGYVQDCHISKRLSMPKGFAEVMESAFGFNGSPVVGKRLLLDCGFTQIDPKKPKEQYFRDDLPPYPDWFPQS